MSTPGSASEREAARSAKAVNEPASILNPTAGRAPNDLVPVPDDVGAQLAESSDRGQPLDRHTGRYLNDRFGYDFDAVRVHADHSAQDMNRRLGSDAFSIGDDLYFASGAYQPATPAGQSLLTHEVTHVVQQRKESSVGQVLQRRVRRDAAGAPTAVQFRIGTELDAGFVRRARTLSADGAITDDDLRDLRQHALRRRGTVSDNERMFMAGLLDPANVAILNASAVGASFQFPIATVTTARLDRVVDLDRDLPANVEAAEGRRDAAFAGGDAIGVLNGIQEVEIESRAAITDDAGSFLATAQALQSFVAAHRLSAASTVNAMTEAASDNSRGDRILAGVAWAVAEHNNHALAPRILAGDIKVDALIPSVMARFSRGQPNLVAGYSTVGNNQGKGDTLYLRTDFDVNDLAHRAVVIHELRHAADDAAASAVAAPSFVPQNQLEATAYRAQARYILDQLSGEAGAAQIASAGRVARDLNGPQIVALVIEARANAVRDRPLVDLIDGQLPARIPGLAAAFAAPIAGLQAQLLVVINRLYGITAADRGVVDGLAGESEIDWAFRI